MSKADESSIAVIGAGLIGMFYTQALHSGRSQDIVNRGETAKRIGGHKEIEN